MIRRLKESENITSDYEQEWQKALRIITRACNRFGYDVRVIDNPNTTSFDVTEDYKYIELYNKYGANVILEMYAPYTKALVRIDFTKCVERYTYGKSKGQCKTTLERAKEFRRALTTGIELATVMESYFGEIG